MKIQICLLALSTLYQIESTYVAKRGFWDDMWDSVTEFFTYEDKILMYQVETDATPDAVRASVADFEPYIHFSLKVSI